MQSGNDILTSIIRRHGAGRPDQVAFHFEGRDLTFDALDRRSSQAAQGILAEGAAPRARIATLTKNNPAHFEIWGGAMKTNTVIVPVNFRLAGPEIVYILNDAQAEILFVGEDHYPVVEAIRPELRTVRKIVALDGGHAAWESYEDWLARQPAVDPAVPTTPDDVTIQMYTSGTTGHPKGVQITHRGLMTSFELSAEQGEWHEGDVSLICPPLFHIGGSGWGMTALYYGVKSVLLKSFDAATVLRVIPEFRITKALLVPSMIMMILQLPQCREADFSSLEFVLYSSSPMPVDLLTRAVQTFGCRFAQTYGLTETSGSITYLAPEDHRLDRPERLKSCGKPYGAEIRVVDRNGRDVPQGQVGEVICRSPMVTPGYWNLPEATAKAIRDGWLYTGDAGYFDADGYLYISDRIKDMIVSGGENIYPTEVESALFSHPAVADVAVIGVPDEKWGETVKAIVVKRPGMEVTEKELIDHARTRIAGYKTPRSIDFVDALPRNSSGKVLKRELRAPYWAGRDRQVV